MNHIFIDCRTVVYSDSYKIIPARRNLCFVFILLYRDRLPSITDVYPLIGAMEKYLGKKYKLKTSENFEEYLKFIEVGLLSRKLVTALSPESILTRNQDGSYSLTVTTPIRKVVITFKLGEEFSEDRPDGVKVKSVIRVEGNSLIQTQVEDNGRKSTHVREFSDKSIIVTTTAEGWNGKCIRKYELVQ